MSVAGFNLDEADQTANLEPGLKLDFNGEKCALIKIPTTQKGFTFDVGVLGIVETQTQNSEHPGEIWVYVPNGVRRLSIQHPQFGSIKDYDLGTRLQKGRTYVLELTTDQVNTIVVDYDNTQQLDITVTPAEATVYINGLQQKLDNSGQSSVALPFGTHTYRITADKYHPEEGQILINDKENRHHLDVNLKPAFGFLTVISSPELAGGELFIDDIKSGTLPLGEVPMKSGGHKVTIHKKLYAPYSETVMMNDSGKVEISPILQPNFAECDIIVDGDKDAMIYVDGEYTGTGRWRGKLEAGNHIMEARKKNHTTTSEEINIIKNVARKVSLTPPMPIYGTLEIQTEPINAMVFLDENKEPIGKTNFYDTHILTGSHRLRLELPGYKTEEIELEIQETEPTRIIKVLTDFCDATISSTPRANILIDGVNEGYTPLAINREAGTYQVTLTAPGYTGYSKRLRLDGNTRDINITLHRNYIKRNEFYLQAGGNIGGLTAINFGLGFYIGNVNVEGNYLLGLSKSETIYWSSTSGDSAPFAATYKPQGFNVKAGYGIKLHRRLRITPQIGCRIITLKESTEPISGTEGSYSSGNYYWGADGAKATSLTAGMRINFAITSLVGISVSPEYMLGLFKSDGFNALADVSTQIKNYSEGFNCNISLNLFF